MAKNQELQELFYSILRKIKREWHKQLHEISPSQYMILKTLNKYGTQKATDLAEAIQMTPGAVTGASDKLVSEGYAERKGATEDRRVVYLEITDKGKIHLESIIRNQNRVTAKVFEGLSDEDVHHLMRIYHILSTNLERQLSE